MLLTAMVAPLRPRMRTNELEHLSLRVMRAVGVRVLIIDELHNALGAKGDGRREFLNLIRFLGNELQIPIVGVGTRDAYLTIRADDQLENRFEPMILPVWQEDDEFLSLLAQLCRPLASSAAVRNRNAGNGALHSCSHRRRDWRDFCVVDRGSVGRDHDWRRDDQSPFDARRGLRWSS